LAAALLRPGRSSSLLPHQLRLLLALLFSIHVQRCACSPEAEGAVPARQPRLQPTTSLSRRRASLLLAFCAQNREASTLLLRGTMLPCVACWSMRRTERALAR
jgi:hypothetical protein